MPAPVAGFRGATLRRPRERAQRVEGVVGDGAAPHQIPERVDGLAGVSAAGRFVQRGEERGALVAQVVEDRGFASATTP